MSERDPSQRAMGYVIPFLEMSPTSASVEKKKLIGGCQRSDPNRQGGFSGNDENVPDWHRGHGSQLCKCINGPHNYMLQMDVSSGF